MNELLPERLERLNSPDFHLRKGLGNGINGNVDVCVMQAVDWLAGGDGTTDSPACASPVIARYCIRLNDSALFAAHRDLLKPYAPRIVGTRDPSGNIDRKRGFLCADRAVRVFAPIILRAAGKNEWADELAVLPAITDRNSACYARDAARKIRDAAAAAYAAHAAAAYAAHAAAADAAYTAADAAATAATAAAADAAYTAANAAAAAAYAAAAADAAYAAAAADAAAYAAADAADAAYAARATKALAEKCGDELRKESLRLLDDLITLGAS